MDGPKYPPGQKLAHQASMEGNAAVCAEFAAGCCPYEEFKTGFYTKTCTNAHDESIRRACAAGQRMHPLEKHALSTFKAIIADVDKKVQYSNECIAATLVRADVIGAIEYAEQLIGQQELSSAGTDELYALLKVHGALIREAETSGPNQQASVCANCGALKNTTECSHQFCRSYAKIRNLIASLDAKSAMQ